MFKKILSACQGEIACRRAAVTTCRMLLGLCLVGAAASSMAQEEVLAKDMREEIVRIQVTVKDLYGRQETKPVPITIYRPEGEGPFPLLVFNHGRATSDLRAKQGRSRPEHLARYFTAKGFVVLAPTRIGYWETYGDFDPEDNRSCSDMRVEAMSTAASDQVLAAVEFAKTLPYVDASRWIVAGQSVGGLISVTTVGRRPAGLLGGINFSGGTGGNPVQNPGRPCSPQQIGRYWGSLAKNAAVPMLWFYWPNDKYWGEDIPKDWFKAWTQGGAQADFKTYGASGSDGHSGWAVDMDHWVPAVDAFMNALGFDKPATVLRPPRTAFAEVGDVARLPLPDSSSRTAYAKFLDAKPPRAFAVGERGAYGYGIGDYAMGRALGFCRRSGQKCTLYAVDDDVVWPAK